MANPLTKRSERFDPKLVYRVLVEATAIADAKEYASFIKDTHQNPVAAARWLNDLESAISGLSELPRRFRVIDEQAHFDLELRQFLHYSHRVIFHVSEATGTVHVLRVYHANRDELQVDHVDFR